MSDYAIPRMDMRICNVRSGRSGRLAAGTGMRLLLMWASNCLIVATVVVWTPVGDDFPGAFPAQHRTRVGSWLSHGVVKTD